jgi:hypothetical protein
VTSLSPESPEGSVDDNEAAKQGSQSYLVMPKLISSPQKKGGEGSVGVQAERRQQGVIRTSLKKLQPSSPATQGIERVVGTKKQLQTKREYTTIKVEIG